MKVNIKFNKSQLRDLKRAFMKSPTMVEMEAQNFLARANKNLLSTIKNNPWEIGQRGGGAPVRTGRLRKHHRSRVNNMKLSITPMVSEKDPNYADFVHGGTRRMEARPWLDYAVKTNERKIKVLGNEMLNNLVKKLAR